MSHYSRQEYPLRAIPAKFHQVLRNLNEIYQEHTQQFIAEYVWQ